MAWATTSASTFSRACLDRAYPTRAMVMVVMRPASWAMVPMSRPSTVISAVPIQPVMTPLLL
jgi:hypothetical protein